MVKVFDGCVSFCTTFTCCVINLIGLFPIINNPIVMRVVWEGCLCIWAGFLTNTPPNSLFILIAVIFHGLNNMPLLHFVNLIVYTGPLGG